MQREILRGLPAPDGLNLVDRELTFAEYWTDDDPVKAYEKKGAKCAEVLVPHRVDARFIIGAYVACYEAKDSFEQHCKQIPVVL